MSAKLPTGRLSRTLSTGRVAAKIGTRQVGFLVKRPFLSESRRRASKARLDADNAQILFQGLSLLRGTALKAAQLLSFERELLPESFQKELGKAYSQVPPINRALVRKIIISSLGQPPEEIFASFDTQAFAAASLGQVHRARSMDGQELAVKIQYPDMKKTIENDLSLLKAVVRPMPDYHLIRKALAEIREVLLLETDYERERENIETFLRRLNLPMVQIPEVFPDLCSDRVLSMSFMRGPTLSQWLAKGPDQEARNHVAQTLNDIFIRGFYGLNVIHADPNPGNFLVGENGKIGLLDFGCVRSVRPSFVSHYRRLIRIGGSGDKTAYKELMLDMGFISGQTGKEDIERGIAMFMKMGAWINQLFREETYDFGKNPDFMAQGHKIGKEVRSLRGCLQGFPEELIFLDRTRYGLIRLFEQMQVKIRIRNQWEVNDHA